MKKFIRNAFSLFAAAAIAVTSPAQVLAAEKSTDVTILKNDQEITTTKTHRTSDLHMSDLIKVVDLSSNNGSVNFTAVKNAGVEGVMLRIGASSLEPDDDSISLDKQFNANYSAASEAGLDIGVYFFSQALSTDEAAAQAEWVNDTLSGKTINLPVAFDYEYSAEVLLSDGTTSDSRLKAAALSADEHTDIARAFCSQISSYGYTPLVYCTSDFLVKDIDGESLAKKYGIWDARYNTTVFGSGDSGTNRYSGPVTMWQCTDSAVIDGVSNTCDLNFYYRPRTDIPAVDGLKVTKLKSGNGNRLKYGKAPSVDGYIIYRATSENGNYKKIATVTKTTYTDKKAKSSRKYYYKVCAYRKIHGITYYGS